MTNDQRLHSSAICLLKKTEESVSVQFLDREVVLGSDMTGWPPTHLLHFAYLHCGVI